MKLLGRLRALVGIGAIEQPASDRGGSGAVPLDRERLETYQTDDCPFTLSPIFSGESWEPLEHGGRRRIPDIHEDLPPDGYSVSDDTDGLDAA